MITYCMVEGCSIDNHELIEIVLVWNIVTMPRYHIKARVFLVCSEQVVLVLSDNCELLHISVLEPSNWA